MKHLKNAGRIALGAMALSLITHFSKAQVGIGTETPQAKLHVHDGSFLITTPQLPAENDPFYDPGMPEPMEYGLLWAQSKGAFRSIGQRVGVAGLDPNGFGAFSFAVGYETFATGNSAFSFGQRTSASGMGSFAGGFSTSASGNYSYAYGSQTLASGHNAIALGSGAIADATNSVVIGNGSTNGKTGSFVLGYGNTQVKSVSNYQMTMAFTGGYRLYTDNMATVGVLLPANGNAWQVTSDVNKKENFAPVNGEDFLNKIARMNLTSWNYKGQDPRTLRHYGPMAQDFFAAFGKDEYGTIGTDTTINQADFDGINLIAIQALAKRTEQLEKQNHELLVELAEIKAQLATSNRMPGGSKETGFAVKK
ncbi:MAG: tail fiber domain-containing protein [Dyadobacter sp.]|uniref:tail fiber domain-containing protein n=1 Tax=Dyadobacter sp. TaxID=1914288 RepID=UPI001B2D14B7|nr:tail fiber domain-containing protein [Dyadobacter sp.]MBO9615480.1 tail fiber domain-containing protein [Dyadobacter sp.]